MHLSGNLCFFVTGFVIVAIVCFPRLGDDFALENFQSGSFALASCRNVVIDMWFNVVNSKWL